MQSQRLGNHLLATSSSSSESKRGRISCTCTPPAPPAPAAEICEMLGREMHENRTKQKQTTWSEIVRLESCIV
jgi:hypothetical protein